MSRPNYPQVSGATVPSTLEPNKKKEGIQYVSLYRIWVHIPTVIISVFLPSAFEAASTVEFLVATFPKSIYQKLWLSWSPFVNAFGTG
jgi:hypothetical protein